MNTLGIISIKGGVGKTSATNALAAALSNQFGKKILAVDANFSAPTLGLHLGIENPETTIHHVLDDKIHIRDAIITTNYGFDILPGARIYSKIDPFKLSEKLREIKKYYDMIILDSSPNLNEEILASMIASDELITVTTPDHVTLNSTLRAIKVAKDKKVPILGMILNRTYGKDFELNLEDIEQASGTEVLAVIPHDINVVESLARKIPSTLHKENRGTTEYRSLAGSLIGKEYREQGFGRFLKLFMKKMPKQEVNRLILKKSRVGMF